MSKGSPPSPSSACFSLNRENGNRSKLTWPCYSDDLSQEDGFGIKLAADLYYYHTLDGSHPSQTEKQELLDVKLQTRRQQEKLDILSSKLSQWEVENEALKAEKAVLVDELAHANGAIQEQHITRRGWCGGSVQLLIDTNSKLTMDNARLQVMVDVMRKSYQSYIKDSRRGSDKDKQTNETLLQLSLSERTAKTTLESSFTNKNQENLPIDSSQHSIKDSILRNSLHSIPEEELKFGTSGDDCVIDGEDIEADNNGVSSEGTARERRAERERAVRIDSMLDESVLSKELKNIFDKGATRCKSADLLVEFGETESQRRKRTDERLCRSLPKGTAGRKYENLLVDFGET